MTAYVALLRGVNLAGRTTLKMADLKAIAAAEGLTKARTFIASGNLLFVSNEPEEALRIRLEARLRAHLSKDVRVMVRSKDEIAAAANANPFGEEPGSNVQVFFLNERPAQDFLASVRNQDDERIEAGLREVYVAYGKKGIGRSRLKIPAADAGTARNMNTVARLAELARELE